MDTFNALMAVAKKNLLHIRENLVTFSSPLNCLGFLSHYSLLKYVVSAIKIQSHEECCKKTINKKLSDEKKNRIKFERALKNYFEIILH